MATIRDYNVTVSNTTASIKVNNQTKTSYAALPTIAEIQSVTGKPVEVIDLNQCFMNCGALTTAPAIPNGVIDMNACFFGCESLTTAPTIPNSVTNMGNCFAYCTALAIAPAIPTSVTNMVNCFRNCKSLTTAPTIPSSVTRMSDCFAYCTALTGKITIDANPSGYVNCMAYTQKEIVLTGSSALLQNIADTATNSNVYVWSLSINLSAERQKDDLSKADVSVIINRFRNNNESVSLTFTINSVESTPVQVTMDTATKTYTSVLSITPTSIAELSVIAEDSYGKSAPKSITIPIPFYTIDFQAGGKEIAVGAPANDDTSNHPNGLFKCVMDAQFYGNLTLGTALSIANGGTGAGTAAGAMANLGVADYIVEQGISGDWKYRKWNSGIAECFGYISLGSISVSAVGNLYRGNVSVSIPADFFNDTPSNVHITNGNPLVHIISINGRATDPTTVSVYVWKATSSAADVSASFYIIGTWK